MRKFIVPVVGAGLLLAACGSVNESVEASVATPVAESVANDDGGGLSGGVDLIGPDVVLSPVTFYVSNQSFEEPTMTITITMDEAVVVDQKFDVGNQHGWVEFDLALPAGEHSLVATAGNGAEFSTEFVTVEGQEIWAIVDYWTPTGEITNHFSFTASDEPIHFA